MNLEEEIFKRRKCDFDTLIDYGFVKEENIYKYSKKILDDTFKVDIIIFKDESVDGKIYDLDLNEEYINFRVERQRGEFVNKIREEYNNILNDIAKKCYIEEPFIFKQTNRISSKIKEIYNDEPEFIWDKFPGYGIFRNNNNKKWYALIMNVDRNKIEDKIGEVEIINVKIDPDSIPNLLKRDGFYQAYHMPKKNWISIILDDTLTDEEIIKYIIESYKYTEKFAEWIIPANPKYYDITNCFNDTDTILWKQSSNIEIGDIIYLYVAEPYSAILYKCEAIEVNIPYEYKDDNLSMKKVMKIKLLKKYNKNDYHFSKIKECGINAIRGPRLITSELKNELDK